MSETFNAPKFDGRTLEIRCDRNEVRIYGSERGLRLLAQLCSKLIGTSTSDRTVESLSSRREARAPASQLASIFTTFFEAGSSVKNGRSEVL